MPIILQTERKSWKGRIIIGAIYLLLIIGSLTMIYPFLVTLATSMSTSYEYNRFVPVLKSLHSRSDRFMRSMASYYSGVPTRIAFPDIPKEWEGMAWMTLGTDGVGIPEFAERFFVLEKDPQVMAYYRIMAGDYARFNLDYSVRNVQCVFDTRDIAGFLERRFSQELPDNLTGRRRRQAALENMNEYWKIPYPNFFAANFDAERWPPMHNLLWDFRNRPQSVTYTEFMDDYRLLMFTPGARSAWRFYAVKNGLSKELANQWPVQRDGGAWATFKEFSAERYPMTPTQPYLLKEAWWGYLNKDDVKESLGMTTKDTFTIDDYNRLFGTSYANQSEIPFPVPEANGIASNLLATWAGFRVNGYPRRLMEIAEPAKHRAAFQESLAEIYINPVSREGDIGVYNAVNGELNKTNYASFADIPLPARAASSGDWKQFIGTLPASAIIYHSAEADFQKFLLDKYGTVEAVNTAYGWNLSRIEEARIPLMEATVVSFFDHETLFFTADIAKGYRSVIEYLMIRGRAFTNTFIYIMIAMLLSLTVNPLAAYALSRFPMRFTEQILLFLIATMAFPGAVTAIPSFLLLRDLQLLNTFYALFLPGMANGMSIFILKCFFDGLPRELYEAASIDGAREWQMFAHISLPMTTPILAINALNAFIGAYNSWEWALIVCQKEQYWTIAVWLYQMSQTWTQTPWLVMVGFVLASIPTAIVFITCQKVILRGIVLPSMK